MLHVKEPGAGEHWWKDTGDTQTHTRTSSTGEMTVTMRGDAVITLCSDRRAAVVSRGAAGGGCHRFRLPAAPSGGWSW